MERLLHPKRSGEKPTGTDHPEEMRQQNGVNGVSTRITVQFTQGLEFARTPTIHMTRKTIAAAGHGVRPRTLRNAVIPISATCTARVCHRVGFISSSDTQP